MTRPLDAALPFLPVLAAAAALVAPAPAAAQSEGRAVAACRAEMLAAFPEGAVRHYRIGRISGPSRSTRVTIYVTADRRYTFDCRTDADGSVTVAAFDPAPRAPRFAGTPASPER